MHGYKIVNQHNLHFITPTVVGWLDIFTRKVYKGIIIDSLRYCIENKGLCVHAYVLMSNHLHLVVSAKDGYRLSDIIRDFKRHTSKKIISEILTNPKESRQEWMLRLFKYFANFKKNNKTYQLWRRDNHPIELASDKWIATKINYIHLNPVRAGLVTQPEHYTYSSAADYYEGNSPLPIDIIELDLLS